MVYSGDALSFSYNTFLRASEIPRNGDYGEIAMFRLRPSNLIKKKRERL